MYIPDVGVNPGYDVAAQHVQAFPECFTLSATLTYFFGECLLMNVDWNTEIRGDFARSVFGLAIDDHHLIEQRVAVHEVTLYRCENGANRLRFVERGKPQANGDALSLL